MKLGIWLGSYSGKSALGMSSQELSSHCHNDTWYLAWLIDREIRRGEIRIGYEFIELSSHCHNDTWHLAWLRVRGVYHEYEFTGAV
ncbi:hypothetical protein J6590_092916 [Homalodisca vitripennis]|nr:hypothetical protein J6590_092916 [Homalodisca vitripennis]